VALEEAPPFWWQKPGLLALLFSPASLVYGWAVAKRMALPHGNAVQAPVLCIGNFIAGGAGKTPTAIALARAARRRGLKPGILSRGYRGHLKGATVVDLEKHTAAAAGDEPLLLAKAALTVVSADRPAGARLLIERGCDFIIMDDGFQNPSLAKDYSLVVVDAKRGVGNGWAMPSGPLRAPLSGQLPHASAILVVGEGDGADRVIREVARRGKPWFQAFVQAKARSSFRNVKAVAFAGIADPDKFFSSLEAAGATIVSRHRFSDHHAFTQEEARELRQTASNLGAELVTTAKDAVRLAGGRDEVAALAAESRVLEIDLEFEDPRAAEKIIEATLANARDRMIRNSSRPARA
jgi:tetraacyldisaccharide 4'-kinase